VPDHFTVLASARRSTPYPRPNPAFLASSAKGRSVPAGSGSLLANRHTLADAALGVWAGSEAFDGDATDRHASDENGGFGFVGVVACDSDLAVREWRHEHELVELG
jgi:hypothetical protein